MVLSLLESLSGYDPLVIYATVELVRLEVGPQRHSLDIFALELVYFSLDFHFIFFGDLVFELKGHVVILFVHHLLPVVSTDEVALANSGCAVDELRSLEEGHAVEAHNAVVTETKAELCVQIDAISNIKRSLHEEVGKI